MMADLKLIGHSTRYRGKVFNLVVDEVEYPSGRRGIREVAEHPGGAVVVPMFDDGRVLLVRQFRYPFQQYVLELPAGKLEPNEDPLHCAQRELEEETGHVADSWQKLTAIYTTPGFCNEVLHIFLAQHLKPSPNGQTLEEGEATLTIESIPFDSAVTMIERGDIVDGKSICGILLADRKRKQQP